jgi:hypothetical protein
VDADGWTSAGGPYSWRTTPDGIVVRVGMSERLKLAQDKPRLCAELLEQHRETLDAADETLGVYPAMLLATIAAESGGNAAAARYEPHLADWSFGVGQVLTRTASAMGKRLDWPRWSEEHDPDFAMPDLSVPEGGDVEQWRRFLTEPWNGIMMSAAVIAFIGERFDVAGYPVFTYAAYNAGSPRAPAKASKAALSGWGLHHAWPAIDAFVNHYSRAMQALRAT